MNDDQRALLRLCTRIDLDDCLRSRIVDLTDRAQIWVGLADHAETHGLAPLLYRHVRHARIDLPTDVGIALRALTLRHKRSAEIRSAVLGKVLDAFAEERIEVVVLKGAALSRILYPDPSLRPMRDLDVLVAPAQASRAQTVLRGLGFAAPARHSDMMHHHHHLPSAGLERDGLFVSMEVHHDALSNDVPETLRLPELRRPLHRFEVAGRSAWTLGHTDMLRHLCHHLLEPAEEVSLLSVADILSYADHFAEQIDWQELQRRYPLVINTIRCIHFIAPLPKRLQKIVVPPEGNVPQHVGLAIKPLSVILQSRHSLRQVFQLLMYPSDWWLHAYYGTPPEHGLLWTRWGRHPARIGYWLYRRARASVASKLSSLYRPPPSPV